MKNNSPTAEEEAHRQTENRRLQSTLFSLQSDRSRLERRKNDLQAEIYRMKTEFSRLKVNVVEKEAAFHSLEREMELMDEEIKRMKKS